MDSIFPLRRITLALMKKTLWENCFRKWHGKLPPVQGASATVTVWPRHSPLCVGNLRVCRWCNGDAPQVLDSDLASWFSWPNPHGRSRSIWIQRFLPPWGFVARWWLPGCILQPGWRLGGTWVPSLVDIQTSLSQLVQRGTQWQIRDSKGKGWCVNRCLILFNRYYSESYLCMRVCVCVCVCTYLLTPLITLNLCKCE